MNIIIHGTKGGYRIFHSTPNCPAIAWDSRSAASSENPVGKSAYSIAFATNGCVFTKYVIVRDIMRNMATGNVAFSVYVPNNNKLTGADTKSLLDMLSNQYCMLYAPNNNLDNVREDWTFVNDIAKTFTLNKVTDNDVEYIEQGSSDAAFLYYSSDEELQKYFDLPYQEEYYQFKQIFFIKNDLRGKPENPLNALQHSDVEISSIDLENKYYYLNNYNGSKGVTITANGKPRSEGKNNNCIRAKWQIEIKYLRDEQCFESINIKGTLSDPAIKKYLEVKDNCIIIQYDAFDDPILKKRKTISFNLKDRKGNPIYNGLITCKNSYSNEEKSVSNNKVEFEGEELKNSWTVFCKKGDALCTKIFIPVDFESIDLELTEKKEIQVVVKDENTGYRLVDFEFCTEQNGDYKKNEYLEFIDEQILENYTISIRKTGYETKQIENFQPYKQSYIEVKLKKSSVSYYSQTSNNYIKEDAKKLQDGQSSLVGNNGNIKKKSIFSISKVIAGLIVGSLILIGIWFWNPYEPVKNKQTISESEIVDYIEGDALLPDKLKEYKDFWGKQQKLKAFENKKEKEKWNEISRGINIAIIKRDLIESKDFEKLQKQPYSSKQKKFQEAVDNIKSEEYKIVGTRLGDISALNLNQIAEKIDAILNALNSQETIQTGRATDEHQENANAQNIPANENSTRSNSSGTGATSNSGSGKAGSTSSNNNNNNNSSSSSRNRTGNQQNHQQISEDKITEIIQYLKGNELNEQKLDEYKKTSGISDPLKASIQLCLNFWELDGTGSGINAKTYYSFRKKIDADKNFNNSKLKTFIERMCDTKENPNPTYSNQDKIKGLIKI